MSMAKLRGRAVFGNYEVVNSSASSPLRAFNATTIESLNIAKSIGGPRGGFQRSSSTAIVADSGAASRGIANIGLDMVEKAQLQLQSLPQCHIQTQQMLSTEPAAMSAQTQLQQRQVILHQHSFLPQASMLKIEPFIPGAHTRLRRPMGRSYSTLASSVPQPIKRNTMDDKQAAPAGNSSSAMSTSSLHVNYGTAGNASISGQAASPSAGGVGIDAVGVGAVTVQKFTARPITNMRRNPLKVVTRQRSKSTSSSASQRVPLCGMTAASKLITSTAPPNCNNCSTSSTTTATSSGIGMTMGSTIHVPPPVTNGSGNGSGNGVIATPHINGIFRIARLPEEQDKQPDRINFDRRGLSAIPIFENEPNLRLLSLQHNLINIFHIPKEASPPDSGHSEYSANSTSGHSEHSTERKGGGGIYMSSTAAPPTPSSTSSTGSMSTVTVTVTGTGSGTSNTNALVGGSVGRTNRPLNGNYGQLGRITNGARLPNTTPPAVYPLALNGSPSYWQRQALMQKNFSPPSASIASSGLATATTTATASASGTSTQSYRFALQKSKSFVTNYPRHLSYMKRNLQKSLLQKNASHLLAALGSNANLKSFDAGTGTGSLAAITSITSVTAVTSVTAITSLTAASGGASDAAAAFLINDAMDEEEQLQQQLQIKNKQLSTSYGLSFQNLVFLDLYDNQIERIANLDGLPALSVLLLGKNRITDISGLVSLRKTLRVLDLHGNKITSISNKINCLHELKSLNLAGNQIRQINQNDFNGLTHLKELNLKRNKIKRIHGFQHLVMLERVYLCHNDVHKVDDMASIGQAVNLLEVTIENNPVSLAGDCVSFLVSYLPKLQSLSQMPITEQVRLAAMAWRKSKELSLATNCNASSEVFSSIRREEVISNARTNWELLRSQQCHYVGQVPARARRSPKHSDLGKIDESNEAVTALEELEEFIKLPSITPHQGQEQQQSTTAGEDNASQLRDSSASSLSPNVNSSSSTYSSDNEESPKLCYERPRLRRHHRPASTRDRQTELRSKPPAKPSNESASAMQQVSALREKLAPQPTRPNDATHPSSNPPAASTAPTEPQSPLQHAQSPPGPGPSPSPNCGDNNSSNAAKPIEAPATGAEPVAEASRAATAATNTTTLATATATVSATASATATAAAQKVTRKPVFGQLNAAAETPSSAASPARHAHAKLARAQTTVGNGPANADTSQTTGPTGMLSSVTPTNNALTGLGGLMGPMGPTGAGSRAQAPAKPNSGMGSSGANLHSKGAPGGVSNNSTNNNEEGATATSVASISTCTSAAAAKFTATSTSMSTSTSTSTTTTASISTSTITSNGAGEREREREQGGDYLIEICGRYLNVYGQGALRFIDKQWNPAKANDVHTLNFSYINFNSITAIFGRMKVRFPHADNFVFRETNINCLGQLNALAELQGITSLYIDPEGNAITTKDLWRQYAIYRLSHWGLKQLNGIEVTDTEIDEANATYAGLSDLILWSMPEAMLQPLLARLRLEESCCASKMSPKEWLMKADNKSLRLVVGKEALQWKKSNAALSATTMTTMTTTTPTATTTTTLQLHLEPQQQSFFFNSSNPSANAMHSGLDACGSIGGMDATIGEAINATVASSATMSVRERGRMHFALMLENTCNAVEKLHKLETLWSSLLLDIVRNTLLDYSQLQTYLRNLMNELLK